MAEERNVLIFEIKKVGVDAANKALKEYVKLSKEADAVKNKSSDGGKTPFTKAASEAGQYGSALEKLNSIQKTSMSIEEKLAGVKASYISKIHEYNAAIKKGVGVAESQLIQSQKHNEHLKGQVARIDNVRSAEILLQNTFKAGLQVFQEHSDAITLMNQRIDSLNPGVKRLTEVWHAKTANELLGAKATREADMAIGMLEKTLKGTTDALKRQEIQEKIAILTQKKATAGVLQNVQAQKLWRDQEASKTRIITQANDVLKKYNLTLRTMDKELKVAKDGVAKLTVMFRQENSIIDGASSVLATYDKRLIKVRTAISKSTDALKTEALALREKALVEARGNTVLAKRTALMKLANTKEKQSELLLKDASVAIVTYNDKIKKLVKSIQDEHNVIKKVTTANKALRQARIEGANLAKYYATELDKVEKELKQNMSAEKRLAVEMRQRALQEAKLNAGVASTSGLLKIKRMRLDALSKSFNTASQAMRRFGRIMIRYVTTTMVAALAQGVKFAANIEAQTVRFGVLTGSLAKGSRLFQEIITFSAKTPFLLPQLDQAAQVLLAFGSPLKDVMTELRMLGDVAQGDAQKLERIATSFGKVRARGTAHMRELNRFIMSGVPIISELNKQFGLTGNTLFTMIQKNQISFDNINKAFKSMTAEGGKFYKMTENVAKTLEGRFSTAVDNMNLNLARLVEDFTPKLKRLLEQFIDWSQAFRTLDKDARKALVTTMAITAAIGPASIAIAGAVKLIGNAMAGNWAGVVIAGIALIASFVGWAVLSKKMGDISAKALALKESTEKLAKAQGFQTNMIPGLTEEMYDLAKAYDAYGMAMAQANERVAIKKKIDSGDVLTTQLRGAFNLIRDMEDFNITVGINYKWYDFNAKGYLAGSLKKYLGELQETIPESETIISQAISEVLGTNRSLESLSTSDLEMFTIADWKALGAKLSTIVGKDLDEFKGIIEKNLKARFDYIGTDAWMRELLGISPEDALNDWGLAVSEGLSKITGDVDTGLIDLASGISRTQQLLTSLPEMLKATIKGLRSGEIKESVWKTDFVGALSIEDAVYQAKQATEKAVTDYSNYLRDISSMRLFQIQDESMIDNYISSILGITDEKDIKKQLQTQLEGYADEFKNIGLTTQELMVLDTGGKLENELKQDLVDKVMASTKVANDELEVLLQAQERISLFDTFFEGDENAFLKASLEAQISDIRAILMAGLTGVADEYKPNVWKVITDAIASGVTDIGATTAFEDFLDLEGITLKVQKFSSGVGTALEGVDGAWVDTSSIVNTTTGTMSKELQTVKQGFSNLFLNDDATALIASMIEIVATLADLKVEVNPLQGLFESYFGAGSKADAEKAVKDMIRQADLNTAIAEGFKHIVLTADYTFEDVMADLLSGDDIPNMADDARAVLEAFFTNVADTIDTGANESIIMRMLGDPKDMKADLQTMLDELNFKAELTRIMGTLEGDSSISILKAVLGDVDKYRDDPAYTKLIEFFELIPKDIEKTDVAEDMIKAFLGTPEDWDDYIKQLRIAESMERVQEIIAETSKAIGISPLELATRAKDLQAEYDKIYTGNIDLSYIPAVDMKGVDGLPPGTHGTVYSITETFDEMEKDWYNLPRIVDGVVLSWDDAIQHFKDTGEHLGKYLSLDEAEKAAVKLHELEAKKLDLGLGGENTLFDPELFNEFFALMELVGSDLFPVDPFDPIQDGLDKLMLTMRDQFLPLMTSLGEAMASGEWGTDGFASSISDLVKTIWDSAGALMFQAGVSLIPTDPALGATLIVGSGVMSLLSGLVSGASGETPITGGASTIGLAKGGIVNSPQLAMIGEGGEPEAVVPLSRASSMGFGGGNVNIVVNNTAKADVETRESTGADGSRQIEFMIYDTVKKGMNSGEFDSPMGSSYGVTRQGRR